MKAVLSQDDQLDVLVATGGVRDPDRHVVSITPSAAVFTFDHGWIRVKGDTVTVCPYVGGKKGREHGIDLAVLGRMQGGSDD